MIDMWTTKKFVIVGLFGALTWALYLGVSLPIIAVAGLGMGVIVQPFFTMLLFMLFKQVLPDFGSAMLLGLVASILFVPLPFFGPPGFLPKILVLLAAGFLMDILFLLLKRGPKAYGFIGFVSAETTYIIFLSAFIAFGVPLAERLISLAIPLAFSSAVEGALGGFCAYMAFNRIKNKPWIKRINS